MISGPLFPAPGVARSFAAVVLRHLLRGQFGDVLDRERSLYSLPTVRQSAGGIAVDELLRDVGLPVFRQLREIWIE